MLCIPVSAATGLLWRMLLCGVNDIMNDLCDYERNKISASTRFKTDAPAILVQHSYNLNYEATYVWNKVIFSGSIHAILSCTTSIKTEFVPRCKQ